MQTHVYANGKEIACKAAGSDGVSPSAFPDPCWSPPPPKAGPIVIPYPNTCFATDITNGTRTVFILGEQVGVEDKSYFSKSTGNEPATQAFKKGVATGVITGKAYFTQWSFDVMFEGLGVPRHQDMVGHNHGSMPSNTPVFPYISRGLFGHDCKKEEKRIERACKPENEHSEAKQEIKKKSRLGELLKKVRPNSQRGRRGADGKHWTDDHCGGLHFALDSGAKAKEYAQQMQEAYKHIPDELNLLNALEEELKSMALKAGAKAAAKWGAKAGLKQLGGSSVPLAGNIAMGLWSAYDAAVAIGDVSEIKAVATETLEQLDTAREKLKEIQRLSKEFENFSKLPPDQQLEKAQQLGAEGQDLLATLNDCTRARKCNLVPYQADGAGNLIGQRGKSKVESAGNGGCCPGQTGHHLVYDAMMKDAGCANYDYAMAPTVCVEGTSQNHGSHGRVHDAMDREVGKLARNGKLQNGSMSMDQTLDAAAKSHAEAFPLSRCSAKCIRAQLDAYYKRMCPNARPKAVNKNGGAHEPEVGGASDK